MAIASCGGATTGDSSAEAVSTPAPTMSADGQFMQTEYGSFNEPWAAAFAPGTPVLFVTEKPGSMKFVDTVTGKMGTVSGLPEVDYGGQGGLGDIAFLPSESAATLNRRTIFLSWAEAGSGDTRGAVVGKGMLICDQADECRVDSLDIIWRQAPKVTGRGHYSHRIAFSPDEAHLYIASGDRQKKTPAQDTGNTLGSIVRLTLDGTPAAGNPFADRNGPTNQIWSYGHRNILGMQFDASGRLWGLEHGPAGGDELNFIERGKNYGWPVVSDGDEYDGGNIPDHSTRPEFESYVINWTPVIAPGDFTFYSGNAFPAWRGDAIIAGLKTNALIRVEMDGTSAREVARYPMGERLRDVLEGPDGALWVLEDGDNAKLLKLMPAA
ncbi:Soluble aldose sugar dehydrogenase YliI [Alteripontixanthobacter maritimus]|uniref:Soluble aldose sugar dehydrogenase YliI n=2 Tax=Alteripontixanthobacter maritimus TaxID=2161824 RepID=A0A369Q762_9SPHN|nr:Soluble aldose sugar dehydrogenase YliI [Alteripontixanthobacter maritimus]